jgi:hypothetical protein
MITLDHNTEKQTCKITSENMATAINVQKKPNDHHFFEIRFETGSVPEELSGRYSSVQAGVKAVENYLRNKRPTAAVRRDAYTEERKQRNATETRTEGGKYIRKGSDNRSG